MPNPTRVAYNADVDKFLGINDDGDTEAYDPEDVPKAVKAGKVTVHMGEPQVLSRGGRYGDSPPIPGSDEDEERIQSELADPSRSTVKINPIDSNTHTETDNERVQRELADPSRSTVRLNPIPIPSRPAEALTPAPSRPAQPAAPPRASVGMGGGLPGMMASFGGMLGNEAMGASPIPGVRPNQASSKMAPGAANLSALHADLMGYSPSAAYSDDLNDAALKKAQDTARQNQFAAQLERAGTTINAALTRNRPDYSSSNDLERMAGQPVQDLLQRRQAADEQLRRASQVQGLQAQQYQRQMQLEMMDPGSDRSARARDVLQQANPEFAKRFTPEEFAKLSANDIGGLGELGKTVLTETARREQADREKDAQIAAAKAAAKAAADARAAEEEKLKTMGETAADRRAAAQRAFEATEHEKNRANARDIAEKGARAQQLAYKKTQNEVSGFEPTGEKALLPAQAEKLQDAVNSRDRLMDGLEQLRQLHQQNPHPAPNSRELAAMQQIVAELKGPMVGIGGYNLTQGHQELTDEMIGDPGKFANWVNSGRLETQIDGMKRNASHAVQSMANSMGQREKEKPGAPHPRDQDAVDWAHAALAKDPTNVKAKRILEANGL